MFHCYIGRRRDCAPYDGWGRQLHVNRHGCVTGRPHITHGGWYRPAVVCPRPIITTCPPVVPVRTWSCGKCSGMASSIAAIITGIMLTIFGAAVCPPVAFIGAALLIGGIVGAVASAHRHCY